MHKIFGEILNSPIENIEWHRLSKYCRPLNLPTKKDAFLSWKLTSLKNVCALVNLNVVCPFPWNGHCFLGRKASLSNVCVFPCVSLGFLCPLAMFWHKFVSSGIERSVVLTVCFQMWMDAFVRFVVWHSCPASSSLSLVRWTRFVKQTGVAMGTKYSHYVSWRIASARALRSYRCAQLCGHGLLSRWLS